jgi:hypothetical protein
MRRVSHYYIAAHTAEGALVGFARVCGDPYVAQVLVRCHYAPCLSPSRDCNPVHAWGAGAPATVPLCVRDIDRWQRHRWVLSTVRVSGLQRSRTEMGARNRGHRHSRGQREMTCARATKGHSR